MSYLSLPALYFPATINCWLLEDASAGCGCGEGALWGSSFCHQPAGWHPQATLFDVTKVILIFSAQHSKRSHGRGCGGGSRGGRGNIGGVVAVGEPASGTTMHSAMGKGNREGGGGWEGELVA